MKEFQKWAQLPPKGWNSWDVYGASVTEKEVRRNAEYLSKNLRKYGYKYVVVDIQWYEPTADSAEYHNFAILKMDQYARLIPDEYRFPSAKNGKGFKPLADYVHSLGLKFGIHIMRGIPRQAVYQKVPIKGTNKTAKDIAENNICPWNSDMYGVNVDMPEGQKYYNSLIELYASWGVDFIKCDDIAFSKYTNDAHEKEIRALRKAIDKVGHPIVLSLSPGPTPIKDASFLIQNANMWRITDDFWDDWELLLNMFNRADGWSPVVRTGTWPDCDMIPIGKIGIRSVGGSRRSKFSLAELHSLMTLWSLLHSPLIIGSELPNLKKKELDLLTNPDILALDNHSRNSYQIERNDHFIIWQAEVSETKYLAVFNISNSAQRCHISDFNKTVNTNNLFYDVWQKKEIQLNQDIVVEKHDVFLLKWKEK